MAAALAQDTVMLVDLDLGKVAERLLQDRTGVEILDLVRPAGAVLELFRTIALDECPAAGLQRLPDAGENVVPQVRSDELDEDCRDDVERRGGPVPLCQ